MHLFQVKEQKTKKSPICPTEHDLFFASSQPLNSLEFCVNHSQFFLYLLPALYDFQATCYLVLFLNYNSLLLKRY